MRRIWDEITEASYEVSNAVRSIPDYIPRQDVDAERLDQVDVARGIAISLMMLSHTTMALNTYKLLPDVAFVPVHLITKFSSSLFILIFGISLSLFYLPHYGTEKWAAKRNRLLWRSFNLLIWYKVLTLVQMFEHYGKDWIIATLKFQKFTDFAEVLNFYWLAIIWIILIIPIWVRMHWVLRLFFIATIAGAGVLLEAHFDWGSWQWKAMLVEHKGAFCYGQFQRGALALFGLFLGSYFLGKSNFQKNRLLLGAVSIAIGLMICGFFLYLTQESPEHRQNILWKISRNWGKHPPNADFMTFSLAGAFTILGFCLLIPNKLTFLLKPFSLIGKEPFFCFNFHLILIFCVYRYALGLRWNVSYPETIVLFIIVFILSFLLSPINTLAKKKGVLFKWLLP